MDLKKSLAFIFSLLLAANVSLFAQTVAMSDNFNDGDAVGWTPDSADNWKVTEGVYHAYKDAGFSGTAGSGNMRLQSIWDDSWVMDDFTIDATLGISPTAQKDDPDDPENLGMGGSWYRRFTGLVFCYQDGYNAYQAYFYAHWTPSAGIHKYYRSISADGADTTSNNPQLWGFQGDGLIDPSIVTTGATGMTQVIQDPVPVEVSRSGDVITVKRHGHIVMQGADTSWTAAHAGGQIALGSRTGGNCGPALDDISVASGAAVTPTWTGPESRADFTFMINEGSGNVIDDPAGHWAECELGFGYKSGEWVDDGVTEGNKSWGSAIGALRIHRVKFGPQFTLEAWFKVPSTHLLPVDESVNLLFCQIPGEQQSEMPVDAGWGKDRGGIVLSLGADAVGVTAGFLASDMSISGVEIEYDAWTHVALVRDGAAYTLYVDGEEAGFSEDTKYGEVNLYQAVISSGQSMDHDAINTRTGALYLIVDQIRLSSSLVEPDDFLAGVDEEVIVPTPTETAEISDDFEDGDATGWSPDSADNWRVTEGVYHAYKDAGFSGTAGSGNMRLQSIWDDSWVMDDFTIDATLGISPTAQKDDPDDPENLGMGGSWYRRFTGLVFCYQDGYNAYQAYFYAHWTPSAGIHKYYRSISADGADTTSNNPQLWGFQGDGLIDPSIVTTGATGMTQVIQDPVPVEVSRSGDVITVKRHGHIVMQGADTSWTAAHAGGQIALGSRTGGNCGPALDDISVASGAAVTPTWTGPESRADFTFMINEGSGNVIDDPAGHWAECELGFGYKSGEWVDDGVTEGNKSWGSAIGALRIHRVKFGPQFTLEAWFKVPSTHLLPVDESVNLLFCQIPGEQQSEMPVDAGWGKDRGGIVLSLGADAVGVTAGFLASDMSISGVEIEYDAWTHVALVRDGAAYTLYVDGEEAGFSEDTKYGEVNLYQAVISSGQSMDHDAINTRTGALYLIVDQIRLTSSLVEPDAFLEGVDGETPGPVVEPPTATANVSDDFEDGLMAGWTPDSAAAWIVEDGILVQDAISAATGGPWYLPGSAVWDDGEIAGDFKVTGKMGWNLANIKDEEAGVWSGGLWNAKWALAAPFISVSDHIVLRHVTSWGGSFSMWRAAPGTGSWVYSPYNQIDPDDGSSSQGVSDAVADIRDVEMSRKGETITVMLDGIIVMQGADTSSAGALTAGWVAVGGGDTGVLVDEIAVSSTVAAAPSWPGPVSQTDFEFLMAEGEGHKIMSTDGGHYAWTELGVPGQEIGAWVDDGATEGNKSWATKFASLKVTRVTISSECTVELWAKIPSTLNPEITTIRMPYNMGGGGRYNPDWGRERGGLIGASVDAAAGTVTLRSTWDATGISGIEGFEMDTWHHVAWVRDGSLVTLYLDGEEVGSGELIKYGEVAFELNQLTFGNSADHDGITDISDTPYLIVDQFRVTSAVLDPDDFLEGVDGEKPDECVKVCDFNEDGNIAINDAIAFLLHARENPTDICKLDWNGDGKYAINDAIMLLLNIVNKTCPDAAVQLAGATDGLQAVKMEGLTQDDIEYIEEMMALMNLTEEQEAAFRVALYGQAGAAALPKAMALAQNSPNPFNPSTTISFTVAEGSAVHVSLKIYDLRGHLVRTLVNEVRDASTYNVFWDGTNEVGRLVSSGVYFYRMQAGDFNQTRKMVLLK